VRTAALAGAACLLALLCAALLIGQSAHAAAAKPRPNFVVIQTDDQTLDQLYAAYTPPGGTPIQAMPNTLNLIAAHGITFNRYYVSYSLCCPSRVTLMTGRYAHNHDVRGNVPPEGGYPGFAKRPAFNHNIATWLQGAGYRTIHIGKFLNAYGDAPYDDGKTVPPGWSAWHSVLHADTDHFFYGYELNNNGQIDGPYGDSGSWETREYGQRDDFGCPNAPTNGLPCYYETDTFNRMAAEEISATPSQQPLYMQVDYTAPHGDFRHPAGPEPAPRHYNSFEGAPLPHTRAQGLDEANVNDKPSFIRTAPFLTPEELHTYRVYYEKALESLRSVDEGVKQIVDTLRADGRLQNTYIIFTSDNGFFYGEHRLTGGKFLAYEPSTHLPFLMRGPGIKAHSESSELAANIDIAPTILSLAKVKPDLSVDGVSLKPFFEDPEKVTNRAILFESFVETNDVEENGGGPPGAPASVASGGAGGGPSINLRTRRNLPRHHGRNPGASASIVAPPKNYYGIRVGPYKYIEWPDGEKELYDLIKDPYELNNRVRSANYRPVRGYLHKELLRLETCDGKTCRELAGAIPRTIQERRQVERERRKKKQERERREREREQRQKKQHHR
jgi:N-acetylglucosamine-6-sulfatase